MLTLAAVILLLIVPVIIYVVQQQQATNPSLRWPKLAQMLGLQYQKDPPRIVGKWNERAVTVELIPNGARLSTALIRPSRLRVEIGPKDLVTRRAGVVVPDPVPLGDREFEERLLMRCSDKAAGIKMMDPMLRRRFVAQKAVDLIGQDGAIQWTLPEATDPDVLEELFKLMSEIASEMENYPS